MNSGTSSGLQHVSRHTPPELLPQFLSVEEFRAFIGIGRSTAYDMLRRGAIPSIRLGRVVRIPREGLLRELEVQKRGGSSDD